MDKKIVEFISEHHVLTLATSVDNQPYCANLFYAYDNDLSAFLFTSNISTRHGSEAETNRQVAASIVLETKIVGKIEGLQITGRMYRPEGDSLKRAKKLYLKSFPYAVVMDLEMWILEVDFAKLTNNRLGFGKKLLWSRDEQ